MTFPVDWVDAFADRAFGGNGCAVVHGGASLDAETCMAFVRETSLVECTFTGPSETADIRVRYCLASREIPFAGHPTIATVVALRHRGLIGDGDLVLETGAGLIPVTVDGTRVTMQQIAPTFGPVVPAEIVAPVYGLAPDDIAHPPQVTSTGLPFCVTPLTSRAALDRAQINPEALRAYYDHLDRGETDLMEPFLMIREGATAQGDTYARLLMTPPSPPEDPFTGSATGAMAAYLWHHGLIDAPQFVAEQGHGLGRPGQAAVEVLGPPKAITGVRVSGQGFVLMSGDLHLS